MTETERIADQLRRAFEGECWHGPAVRQILEGITPEQAAARPVANAHSILELVLHMTVWKRAVAKWLAGSREDVSPEQDWTPAPAGWPAALAGIEAAHRDLLAAVAKLDDAQLEHKIPIRDYTVYFALHGVVQHDVYHAGQIQLLKQSLLK